MGTRIINNQEDTLKADLAATLRQGARVSIASACFSMYAYQELKTELEGIEELRFIFTSPTFVKDGQQSKQKREFYIPKLDREHSLYGTEFEIKLRNEMTQRAIARECADWIRRKVTFKSNVSGENIPSDIIVTHETESAAYLPVNEFTTVGLGCERGNNLYTFISRFSETGSFLEKFNEVWNDTRRLQDVSQEVLDCISTAYAENSPELIYFIALFNIFSEFLEDISEDVLPNEGTGFRQSKIWNKLYDFQKQAALAIINKLEKYNGCILADSVGLGKTFTALSVIKYYENRNKNVLVLCPKKLADNWNTYKDNYINNPIAEDRLGYKVLFHSDLSRTRGQSNGTDLSRFIWSNYDLIVIDESHNFRNGAASGTRTRENRYERLMNQAIKKGVKTKVLMLSATPVNNRFADLEHQLALAYEDNPELINDKLNITKDIKSIFRQAQKAFNEWGKLPAAERTTQRLLGMLDFDFFEVLDSVTIARSRKHIRNSPDADAIGQFPQRLKPISLQPGLTDLPNAVTYNDIYTQMLCLNLHVYIPSFYIYPSRLYKYTDDPEHVGLTQAGREFGIRRLMSTNMLKRLESSVHSFYLTLQRVRENIQAKIDLINDYEANATRGAMAADVTDDLYGLDEDDEEELYSVGKGVRISLEDIDWRSWRDKMKEDAAVLDIMLNMVKDITPAHDSKLQELKNLIIKKQEHPLNEGNKKLIIFSAFSDTAEYLYRELAPYFKHQHQADSALITGQGDGSTTIRNFSPSLNSILTCFSPVSKEKALLMPDSTAEIDILFATDCISEGQNLQDCDYVVNYDIHWNPVRIIQRFGRVDRLGSRNTSIQLVNFWPDMDLDEYIHLKSRVQDRMKATVMTSTGDDDPINEEEEGDLEYRKKQLQRLQEEVVDLEDMTEGVSIMDLGLNDFRTDLLEYREQHPDVERMPHGMHAVVPATEQMPRGCIFILRNVNDSVNVDARNLIHPFYMVYMSEEGETVCDYLNPKKLLDSMRALCRGRSEPLQELCREFNAETNDGRDMHAPSELLSKTIESIISTKEEGDIDSLFTTGLVSEAASRINGLDDFELICFLVVR